MGLNAAPRRLKQYREYRRLTQVQLAEKLFGALSPVERGRVSEPDSLLRSIKRWESGRGVRRSHAEHLARILDCKVEALYGDEQDEVLQWWFRQDLLTLPEGTTRSDGGDLLETESVILSGGGLLLSALEKAVNKMGFDRSHDEQKPIRVQKIGHGYRLSAGCTRFVRRIEFCCVCRDDQVGFLWTPLDDWERENVEGQLRAFAFHHANELDWIGERVPVDAEKVRFRLTRTTYRLGSRSDDQEIETETVERIHWGGELFYMMRSWLHPNDWPDSFRRPQFTLEGASIRGSESPPPDRAAEYFQRVYQVDRIEEFAGEWRICPWAHTERSYWLDQFENSSPLIWDPEWGEIPQLDLPE